MKQLGPTTTHVSNKHYVLLHGCTLDGCMIGVANEHDDAHIRYSLHGCMLEAAKNMNGDMRTTPVKTSLTSNAPLQCWKWHDTRQQRSENINKNTTFNIEERDRRNNSKTSKSV
jgi:hypothetical protein